VLPTQSSPAAKSHGVIQGPSSSCSMPTRHQPASWPANLSTMSPLSLWLPCALLSCLAEPITVTVTATSTSSSQAFGQARSLQRTAPPKAPHPPGIAV
jgi:hypothetical protein